MVPWPKSLLPVRNRTVLSGRISIHEAGSDTSNASPLIIAAAFALRPRKTPNPTTSAPPALTKLRRLRRAPHTSVICS